LAAADGTGVGITLARLRALHPKKITVFSFLARPGFLARRQGHQRTAQWHPPDEPSNDRVRRRDLLLPLNKT